jgi:hypothetical protein
MPDGVKWVGLSTGLGSGLWFRVWGGLGVMGYTAQCGLTASGQRIHVVLHITARLIGDWQGGFLAP